mmetsp:Transcript_8061/g.23004  ORF Transcript_8061/g.23004 Transcript_8061/m.23004 type:complete len:339 (-) Transcript_8061:378-1394(-)
MLCWKGCFLSAAERKLRMQMETKGFGRYMCDALVNTELVCTSDSSSWGLALLDRRLSSSEPCFGAPYHLRTSQPILLDSSLSPSLVCENSVKLACLRMMICSGSNSSFSSMGYHSWHTGVTPSKSSLGISTVASRSSLLAVSKSQILRRRPWNGASSTPKPTKSPAAFRKVPALLLLASSESFAGESAWRTLSILLLGRDPDPELSLLLCAAASMLFSISRLLLKDSRLMFDSEESSRTSTGRGGPVVLRLMRNGPSCQCGFSVMLMTLVLYTCFSRQKHWQYGSLRPHASARGRPRASMIHTRMSSSLYGALVHFRSCSRSSCARVLPPLRTSTWSM